jgi:glycosyltransferase involved in cell wall biosynthesis
MPIYNGATPIDNTTLLERSLDAILAQEYEDFELIIADNASTDASADICRRYAARDRRIQFHTHAINHGGIYNFEWLRSHATSEFFVWVAHDDVWAPDFLKHCIDKLDAVPSAALCTSFIVQCDALTGDQLVIDLGFSRTQMTAIDRIRTVLDIQRSGPMQNLVYGVYRRAAMTAMPPILTLNCWGADRLWVLWLVCKFEITQVNERLFYKFDYRHTIIDGAIAKGIGIQNSSELFMLLRHAWECLKIPVKIPKLPVSLRFQIMFRLLVFFVQKANIWKSHQ